MCSGLSRLAHDNIVSLSFQKDSFTITSLAVPAGRPVDLCNLWARSIGILSARSRAIPSLVTKLSLNACSQSSQLSRPSVFSGIPQTIILFLCDCPSIPSSFLRNNQFSPYRALTFPFNSLWSVLIWRIFFWTPFTFLSIVSNLLVMYYFIDFISFIISASFGSTACGVNVVCLVCRSLGPGFSSMSPAQTRSMPLCILCCYLMFRFVIVVSQVRSNWQCLCSLVPSYTCDVRQVYTSDQTVPSRGALTTQVMYRSTLLSNKLYALRMAIIGAVHFHLGTRCNKHPVLIHHCSVDTPILSVRSPYAYTYTRAISGSITVQIISKITFLTSRQ